MKNIGVLFILFLLISCGVSETATQPSRQSAKTAAEMERAEFKELYKKDSLEKRNIAAAALNVLLNDNDSRYVSVMVKNASNCDIILRFSGAKPYNLPIKKNDKNFIVIEKGEYYLGANLCNSRFSSSKIFNDSVTFTLSEN